MQVFYDFLAKLEDQILMPIITLLALAAFIMFVVGVIGFIRNAENPTKRSEGTQHIIWGLIGLVIIFGANAIILVLRNIVNGF